MNKPDLKPPLIISCVRMFNQEQIAFLDKLIRCKSVTPENDNAIETIIEYLGNDFSYQKLVFSDHEEAVHNLYVEIGSGAKNLCFAGHSDVVTEGKISDWTHHPFQLTIEADKAYGRGLVDMKGAIFSFIVALKEFLSENRSPKTYKISLLISGNEEGNPKNGMVKLIPWLKQNKIKIDDCIIGEPTSEREVGDTVKIGRRGSITFDLHIVGKQGHVAYPHKALNPITILVNILKALKSIEIDQGNEYFPPSNLEITNIHVNNSTSNVIPQDAKATFNIRFNDEQNESKLVDLVVKTIKKYTDSYNLTHICSAESFIQKKNDISELALKAIKQNFPTLQANLSTSGGTSDARFLKDITNIVELGLLNKTAHQVNEFSHLTDLYKLSKIYKTIIDQYFAHGMER